MPSATSLHEAAWPNMFADLQVAYAELTQTRVELERRVAEINDIRELFERVIESMSEALFLTDVTGQVIQANHAASVLLGCNKADLIYRPLAEVLATAEVPATPWQLLTHSPDGTLPELEIKIRTRTGEPVPLSLSCDLVRDRRGKITGVLIVARNITERKEAEAALRQAHDELEQRVELRTAELANANTILQEEIIERKRIEEEKAKLFEAVSHQREEVRALAMRLAEVQEAERRELVGELHDQVGQNLSALGFNLSFIQTQIGDASPAAASIQSRLADSLDLIEQMMDSIRDMLAELRPPLLDDYGLVDALEWYAERFTTRLGLTITLQSEPLFPRLAPPVENALFRIAQEALTNVARHAQASQVTVSLEVDNQTVRMVIADNGVGFEPISGVKPVTERQSWGLLTMAERAKAVNGRCWVESQPGHGTRVVVEGPIAEAYKQSTEPEP